MIININALKLSALVFVLGLGVYTKHFLKVATAKDPGSLYVLLPHVHCSASAWGNSSKYMEREVGRGG